MDAKNVLIGFTIILLIVGLSGCEEQGVTTEKEFENVYLDSDIVEFAYANLSFVEKREINDDLEPVMVVKQADVKYLFENIAGRDIVVNVTVEFYDQNDTLVHSAKPVPSKNSLPEGYRESDFNTASYNGKNVGKISYVRIFADPIK